MFSILSKRKNPNLLLFGICWIFTLGGWAQVQQTGRYEISLRAHESSDYTATSAQEKGLLVYRRILGIETDQIKLIRLDTSLNEVWHGSMLVDKSMMVANAKASSDSFYLLFKHKDYASGDFILADISIENGTFKTFNIRNPVPFLANDFVYTAKAALIGGYYNYRPIILHFDFSSKQSRVLPGFFNEKGELDQIRTNEDASFDVIVSTKNFGHGQSLWIRHFDPSGELINTTLLQPEDGKNLLFGRSLRMANGEEVVCGTYGRNKNYSRGVFIAGVSRTGEYKINYYNYGDLQHFFSYMKARRKHRVEGRIQRRRIRGKKLRFNYRLLVHQLIPYQGQYIMLGEAFYPHYSYPKGPSGVTSMLPTFYSAPASRGDFIFDGFQYTHAVVMGFNPDGKLQWDNSFEINDVRTYQIEQFVKLKPEMNRIILLYLFDNQIRSKVIQGSEILEGKSLNELKLKFSGDQLVNRVTSTSTLDYWYDGYFFVFGNQQVKNLKNTEVDINRRVFYINKITYK